MLLLLLAALLCVLATLMLLRGASCLWYMCLFIPFVSVDLFGLRPGYVSNKGFYDLASDVCILFFFLLLYTDIGTQARDTRRTDASPLQSLSGRFVTALVLVVYGVVLNPMLTSSSTRAWLLVDTEEVALTFFKTYMSALGLVLLWRTWQLKKLRLELQNLEKR